LSIRIPSDEQLPARSRQLLKSVAQRLRRLPNFYRLVAHSPAALAGLLALLRELQSGSLPAQTRTRIALALSELNACDYCLSAQVHGARASALLDDCEITANRSGSSNDLKAAAAVRFAVAVVRQHGRVDDEEFEAVRAAGYDAAQLVEIVQQATLTLFSNYLNTTARTPIDFPVVHARRLAQREAARAAPDEPNEGPEMPACGGEDL
jgi:uncharacterized peroxidase-related enzyme